MVNESTENNEANNETKTSNEIVVKSEPTTSVCHIKDEPIEKFTKVSKFMVDNDFFGYNWELEEVFVTPTRTIH